MAVTAQNVLDRVRSQLVDTGASPRWTDNELLRWISDGQRTIVSAVPRASSYTANMTTVAGARQTLPADAFQLIRCGRNMGAAGTTPSRTIMPITREHMDIQFPTWPSDTGENDAKVFMYDLSEPEAFYIYPPSTGSRYIEILYSKLPAELSATTDVLTVKDIYLPPLFDYVMYRAHMKDSDYAAGMSLAEAYLKSFTAFLASLQKDEQTNATTAGKK